MDGSNPKHLSPEGESSSFDTASDNSQEEKVSTVKKRDFDKAVPPNCESEASENVGDIKNRSRLNDFDGENSSENSNWEEDDYHPLLGPK